jgi:polysaccharide deacetylase
MSLAMSLRGRGPVGSAARTARVLSRFGPTASAMAARLDRYGAIASEHGVRPTWPTTACVLARHPDLLRVYADRGAELAVHGLVHGDHAGLDRAQQWEAIAGAVEIFERCGVRPTGFRGPYLRYNEATLDVIKELGLRYHSSQAVAFPLHDGDLEPGPALSYRLALELYSARDALRVAVVPRLRAGLVDIPVAVPDDEILIERLRLGEQAATVQWLGMFEMTYDRGELFTVQLHPERIGELQNALRATLAEARRRRPCVFMARLDDIASWWERRSGFSLDVQRSGDDRFRVHLRADPDATLLVRGLEVAQSPWYGRDAICRQTDFEVESPRVPVVGVSRRSPAAVHRFIAEEGLPYEVSDARDAYGAYVDVATERWTEHDVLDTIQKAPGPLARIWRWPEGARSALAVTGDIDALTLRDFVTRSWETRGYRMGGVIEHEPSLA